jgi:hypothetical protein
MRSAVGCVPARAFLDLACLGVAQWSEIRELTHRARRGKELEGKDTAKSEALKAVMGSDARMQALAQV